MVVLQPAIKWSGSKRSQASEIINYFPKELDTYYEPFCGGCSILGRLLISNVKVSTYVCSDINKDLITLWNAIKENPSKLDKYYEEHWLELNKDNNIGRKKEYFNFIRDKYNEERLPEDFLFIMRTTTNGMPRYNSDGKFNNSFHLTRNGIQPDKLKIILKQWSNALNQNNVKFIHQSYENIRTTENDFMYLDPPYASTKGMYFGTIDYNKFFNWLRSQQSNYLLSFDGISDKDNTYNVPKDLYNTHIYLHSGKSSFRRIIGKSNDIDVYESLYIKGVIDKEDKTKLNLW